MNQLNQKSQKKENQLELIREYAKAKREYNQTLVENLDYHSLARAKAMVESEAIGELCTRLEWQLKFLLKEGGGKT